MSVNPTRCFSRFFPFQLGSPKSKLAQRTTFLACLEFHELISSVPVKRVELFSSLSAADRQEVEGLLLADEEASERHLFESFHSDDGVHSAVVLPHYIRDYELREIIGEGGMGTVYRGLHTRLQCDVAVKLLPRFERHHRPESIERFEREMAAVGQLRHPHIVRATDAGEEDGVARNPQHDHCR